MAKPSLSPSSSSKDTSSFSSTGTDFMLENLIGLAKERSDVECQHDLPLVMPVIATRSLTQCLSNLHQGGSTLASESSSSVSIVDGALKEPASNMPAVSTSTSIAHSKAGSSPGTEFPVMVKPTTHVDLLHSTPLYYTDDLENFNVVQEETVPMETKSDEESESFVPPVSRKPCMGREGLPSSSSSSAPLHQNISGPVKSCICGECGKVFATKRNLNHHIKVIHVSEQTYSCQVCGKVFRHFHNMNIHKQTQHHFTANEQHLIKPAKNFECPICQKMFQHKSNLVTHYRLHSGERPFKCAYCGRGFVQSSNCKKHELTHTHQRPYSCCHCPKSFTSSCNLQRHQLSHHEGKNYLCPFCGKSFTQRWNLKKHEKRHTKD